MAASLKEAYVKKCADMACEAPTALLEDLDADATSLKLNGNSKRLFNNRLSYMQVVALCEVLYEDTRITSLDVSYNNLNDMAAQALARLIKVNHTLCYLNLAGNDVTAVGAKQLADALSHPDCALQVLLLSGNPLEDAGVVDLGASLRTNRSLLALDLCNTGAGIMGILSVCIALGGEEDAAPGEGASSSGCACPLESLDLGRPMLPGTGPQDTTILAIAKMLASNTSLRHLALSKHGMSDSQLDSLVTYGLLRNSSLSSLDLRANKLSPFAGTTLERLLNEHHQLSDLDLSSNPLGDGGALALARCLPYAPWLTRLDLRSCSMGDAGLSALAEALTLAGGHMQSLLLWGNSFGPGASRAFLDTLATVGDAWPAIDIKVSAEDGVAQVALMDEAAAA